MLMKLKVTALGCIGLVFDLPTHRSALWGNGYEA